ncbi:MAG: DNA polymerase III subunit alpha, partial [Patescibacteria group bacterium]
MSNFVHLHTHSHYSLLDGLTKIPDLVRVAKERGFSAIALTDSGSLYGAIEFYEACHKEDVKPIIGFEAYLAPNGRFSKQAHVDTHASHLVLLAETYDGYKNLMKLSSAGHLEGFYYKPRIDKELLREHHAGIIALSGCLAGELAQTVKNDDTLEKAKRIAQEYVEIFGKDNFFIELQDHPELDGQITVNTKLVQLARETDIPLVVTRDVHYLNRDDTEAQDILTCIREGKTVDQPNRFTFQHVDRSLCTAEDIASRFQHVPDALENTVKIAERVNCEIPLHQWHFPPVELPEGKTADAVLRESSNQGLAEKLVVTPELQERLDYELDIITKKGYSPYFLVVADLMRYAHEQGIIVTTRGSAAGSLVSYALGIVSVNPLFFRLPFERFLNPYRPSPPDIDMDFADDRREDMLAYATEKYGVERVAQIITFGTMMARGSVRDAGRALGFAYGFCDQVAKLIPFGSQGFAMTIKRALSEEPELKKLYESNADVKRLLAVAQKIEGCARHTSIHAAGVVIAPTALTDFTPVQYETGGEKITTQYEMYSVEAAGLLKMDFLGIRNLAILGHAVEFVEKTTGAKVDINNLPWDDKKTFEMLARGETMGTFQLGGSGMTRWLKELKPTTIHDIMVMVALFRPGPMESIPEYIRRKHNPKLVEYLDPRLEEVLERSFGILVYQEDVMLTAIKLAGYDWLEADKFRKAMGKKIPAEMAKQKIKFSQGCRTHGNLPEEKIERLWQLIEPFAAYGFGKAHAASYAVVAYQTAYLKAHYPVQFMTAILTAEAGDMDKVAAIVHECERMGILVLSPDINESFRDFATIPVAEGERPRIRFGLNAIKNLGAHIAEVIYRERKERGA